ncbi:hypothetical protein L3X38_025191 [Prunus dulcis]|uniref:Uncharacterized protein n=1 Tax=Prunus dulcis TaxID=3755 RepID=A0AAD4W1C7_PRUDU|nr:hypothetical protein L3X38_025191 [Prunus dulcis]
MPKCSYNFKSGGVLTMTGNNEVEISSTKSPNVSTTRSQQSLGRQGKEAGNHADWENLDEFARGSIEQHLTDEVLCNAMKDIAKQTWEKLDEMFAAKSLSNKFFLKKELHSLKMEEGASMMEHVSAFNRCIADL